MPRVTDLVMRIHSSDYHVAIHSAIDLVQALKLNDIEQLIILIAPDRKISVEMFDICCDAFQIVQRVRQNRSKIPDKPPKVNA